MKCDRCSFAGLNGAGIPYCWTSEQWRPPQVIRSHLSEPLLEFSPRLRLRADPLGVGGRGERVAACGAEAEARRQAGRGGLGAVDPARRAVLVFAAERRRIVGIGRIDPAGGNLRPRARLPLGIPRRGHGDVRFRVDRGGAAGRGDGPGRRSRRSVALAAPAGRPPRVGRHDLQQLDPRLRASRPWSSSSIATPATRTAAANSST